MSLKLVILIVSLIILWPIAVKLHHKWRQRLPICEICDHKLDARIKFGKGQRWYCTKVEEYCSEPGRTVYKSICGIPRIKTSPVWCPKRKRQSLFNTKEGY